MATADANHTDGIQLSILLNGTSYSRTYYKSDAVNNVIVLGRLSSTTPDTRLPAWGSPDQQTELGGFIVSPGRAAFVSPVMSRQHARLVFSGDNEVYISDPPNHSHHGTYISRNGRTFRVDHPQPLQTGDVVTFGKTVHRGGQVYEPLSAKVRILSVDTTHQSFASYTGHGYSLPPNIDIEVDVEEDNEVFKDDDVEHPSTHKFYAVQEVQEDPDEIASLPSPIFPRGLDARPDPPPLMPGGFHGIPEASPFAFNMPPQHCLFEPASQVPSFLPNALPNPSQDFAPFIATLAPIFRGAPPPLPPVLPSIIQPRVRPTVPIPADAEVINVDDHEDDRDIIDVDAVGSTYSSVRETSPFEGSSRSSLEESDYELRTDSRAGSPATSAGASEDFSAHNSSSGETEKFKDVLRIVKDLTNKLDKLLAYRNQSKRRIVANKVQLDTKIASLQQNLALLRSKVEVEQQDFASDLERYKKEIKEDIDTRKRGFMDDLSVYEDDVTYEVDRVMDSVEELNVKAGEGKAKVDEYVESVRKLKEELEAAIRAEIDEIRNKGVGAATRIDEVVAGVKRKHDALEEVDARARSPSVAMSMSPEPEAQLTEIDTIAGNMTTSNVDSIPNSSNEDAIFPIAPEPPRKRQKLGSMEAQSGQAARMLGAVVATTLAVCWTLGKIGEMSTLGDV